MQIFVDLGISIFISIPGSWLSTSISEKWISIPTTVHQKERLAVYRVTAVRLGLPHISSLSTTCTAQGQYCMVRAKKKKKKNI